MKNYKIIIILFLMLFFINGCTLVFQKGRRSDTERIKTLEGKLSELQGTKSILEDRLSQEIKDKQVRLKMLKA